MEEKIYRSLTGESDSKIYQSIRTAMHQFYQTFPIRYALRSKLTWSNYHLLMRVEEESRHEFYLTC